METLSLGREQGEGPSLHQLKRLQAFAQVEREPLILPRLAARAPPSPKGEGDRALRTLPHIPSFTVIGFCAVALRPCFSRIWS